MSGHLAVLRSWCWALNCVCFPLFVICFPCLFYHWCPLAWGEVPYGTWACGNGRGRGCCLLMRLRWHRCGRRPPSVGSCWGYLMEGDQERSPQSARVTSRCDAGVLATSPLLWSAPGALVCSFDHLVPRVLRDSWSTEDLSGSYPQSEFDLGV